MCHETAPAADQGFEVIVEKVQSGRRSRSRFGLVGSSLFAFCVILPKTFRLLGCLGEMAGSGIFVNGAIAMAWIFGLILLMLCGAWLALLWRKRQPLQMSTLQAVLYGINYLVARILWRAKVVGEFPVGDGQGAVVVSNHRSSLDPSFIQILVDRPVHWMVAAEYFANPVLGYLLRLCMTIPAKRNGLDTTSAKTAIKMALDGSLVGIFPEGTVNETDEFMLPGLPGAALVALKAQVPIVPCYIEGSPYDGTAIGCLLMPAKVTLVIGEPIDLSPYHGREGTREAAEEVTELLMRRVAELAGRPEYEPRVRRRRSRNGRVR